MHLQRIKKGLLLFYASHNHYLNWHIIRVTPKRTTEISTAIQDNNNNGSPLNTSRKAIMVLLLR